MSSADNDSADSTPVQETVASTTPAPAEAAAPDGGAEYGADQIEALKGLEGIRMRPAMYIGGTDTRGLHHLVFEVVDNCIDEFVAGYGKLISVHLNLDGSLTCNDDGRGIPVGPMAEMDNKPAMEVVLTSLHAGGKFDREGGYKKGTGGLHGVGIKAVNALSEWLVVESRREGHVWRMEFSRGEVTSPLARLGSTSTTGTKMTFKPDPKIFDEVHFSFDVLHRRLQELAFLNRGVRIRLVDEQTGQKDEFCYQGGLDEFVAWLNRTETPLFPEVIRATGSDQGISVDVAMQYNDGYNENVRCFANNIPNPDGGTHLSGFRSGLTRTLNSYGKKSGVFKDLEPSGDDFREGLTAVVNVNIPDPQFQSQNKTKLLNVEVEGADAQRAAPLALDRRRVAALLRGFDDMRRDADSTGDMIGMDAFNKLAIAMLTSDASRKAFDLTKEDAVDDLLFNEVIWRSVRGTASPMPPASARSHCATTSTPATTMASLPSRRARRRPRAPRPLRNT